MPGGLRQHREVLVPVAVQGDAAAEAAPRSAHVGVGLGQDPLLQRLFADRKQRRAAALSLGTHDLHAPLVDVAGASPTRNGLDDFDLFAGTGVLDNMPDVDDAIVADVGALKAGVMRLYSVVLGLSRWVRVGCAWGALDFSVLLMELRPPE